MVSFTEEVRLNMVAQDLLLASQHRELGFHPCFSLLCQTSTYIFQAKISIFVHRPATNLGEPLHDRIPPNAWQPMSPQHLAPPSNAGLHGLGNRLPPRFGDIAATSAPVSLYKVLKPLYLVLC